MIREPNHPALRDVFRSVQAPDGGVTVDLPDHLGVTMAVHECFPYLRVRDAEAAIAFYLHVFEGTERFRLVDPSDGRIGHAELDLAPGVCVMLSAEYPEMGILAPTGNTGQGIHLHVDDADALLARAEAAGARISRPATDQFYGERSGTFVDPFGHEWQIGHSIEEVAPEEMQRRWDAMSPAT